MSWPFNTNPWGMQMPPQQPVMFVPMPLQTGEKKRRGGNKKRNILDEIEHTKMTLERLERLFKKEEKKDDKKGTDWQKIYMWLVASMPVTTSLWIIFLIQLMNK